MKTPRCSSGSGRSPSDLTLALASLLLALGTGCATGGVEDFCDLPGDVPTTDDVGDGRGTAQKDGASFDEAGTYSTGSMSVTLGLLDMTVDRTEDGDSVRTLFEEESFPICVKVRDRSETSGQVNFVEGGFVTDAEHTGSVSMLSLEDGILTGRFSFTLANTAGTEMVFEDGVFRVGAR
jgi:hypothetical protein